MKKTIDVLKFILRKFIFPTACFFSAFIIILLFGESGKIMRDKALILLFAAAGVALANMIFFFPKISVYLKTAAHFVLLGLLFLSVLWLSDYMKTGRWVLLLVGYLIVYALAAPVALLIYRRRQLKKKEQEPGDYDQRFS